MHITENDPLLSQIFGYAGLVLWSFQLAPQVWKSFKEKSTGVLSAGMMLCWAVWAPFFAATAINNHLVVPNIIQPNIFGLFATICFVQVLMYGKNVLQPFGGVWATVGIIALLGGLEVALTFADKAATTAGKTWIPSVFGVIAPVLIIGGFLPQYWDVFKYKDAEGISLAFLALDISGGILSIISLVFQTPFDRVSFASYAAVVLLDIGLIICYVVLGRRSKVVLDDDRLEAEYRIFK